MPSKRAGRDQRDPADADVALGVAGDLGGDRGRSADEGVGEDDRAGAGTGREVGADAAHRLGDRGLVTARVEAPGVGHGVRVEVGQAVEGDGTVLVLDHHRIADPGEVGADVDAGGVDQARGEPEPLGRVVVAGGEHDPGARGGQPRERLVGEAHGVDRRQGAVVDVARDEHHVDLLGGDDLEQVVDVGRLVREHALPVEGPAQVPVGGVQQAHGETVGESADSPGDPRRGPRAQSLVIVSRTAERIARSSSPSRSLRSRSTSSSRPVAGVVV